MEQLLSYLTTQFMGIALWTYFAALGSILGGFVAKKIAAIVFGRLMALSEKTENQFDDIFVGALSKPVQWTAAMGGIFLALLLLPLPKEPINIDKFVHAMLTSASLLMIMWFATRLVDGITDWWGEKAETTESRLDDQLVPIVRKSLKAFLYIISVVLVLQNLGYSVQSLLAGLGIGGLAMAMAAKDTVANLFGSVIIFLDKPFQVGDWIETASAEGTVEEIGLRTTRVRTFANSIITVPNASFTTDPVNNWSRMKKRRIKMTIGVTYSTRSKEMSALLEDIRGAIRDDPNILNDFFLVNFDNFGPSSLDIFIYCFTATTVWADFLSAKEALLLRIMELVEKRGLSFAFPTRSVHVESLPATADTIMTERPR